MLVTRVKWQDQERVRGIQERASASAMRDSCCWQLLLAKRLRLALLAVADEAGAWDAACVQRAQQTRACC